MLKYPYHRLQGFIIKTIEKRNIKIKGQSIPIDLYFLDALSLKHFDSRYDAAKTQTNKLVREISKDVILHPQNIERCILNDFLSKKTQKELKKVDNYKPFSYN